MTDITKLIEDACDCARQIGITEAGRAHGCFTRDDSRFLTAMQQSKSKHVAALQSAIEALQWEVERLKRDCQFATARSCNCNQCPQGADTMTEQEQPTPDDLPDWMRDDEEDEQALMDRDMGDN